MTSTLPTLRIAAVGDSLTKGYLTFYTTHPYTDVLKAQGILVSNFGVSGCFTSDMKSQLRKVIRRRSDNFPPSDEDENDSEAERKERRIPYDYAVILGGTNDLGCDLMPETVLENLQAISIDAAAEGIYPFLVTVPPLGKRFMTEGNAALRDEVNAGLKQWCEGNNFGLVDLYSAVVDPGAPHLRDSLTGDQLHLNEKGYDLMGEVVFAAVAEHFERTHPN